MVARDQRLRVPSLRRRLIAGVYEGLLLFGVVFIAAYLFSALTQFKIKSTPQLTLPFQLFMFAVIGCYFIWCWRHGGQTLPMKTWKFKVARADGSPLHLGQAWLRYTVAAVGSIGLAIVGVELMRIVVPLMQPAAATSSAHMSGLLLTLAYPFLALLDRDRQFLHDRLAGTRLVTA